MTFDLGSAPNLPRSIEICSLSLAQVTHAFECDKHFSVRLTPYCELAHTDPVANPQRQLNGQAAEFCSRSLVLQQMKTAVAPPQCCNPNPQKGSNSSSSMVVNLFPTLTPKIKYCREKGKTGPLSLILL